MDRPVEKRRLLSGGRIALGVAIAALVAAAAFTLPTIERWWSAERSFDYARLRVGTVTRGTLERDLSVQGKVVAAFHPTTFSPSTGIVSLKVRAGDVVEKGQVLAVVDSPELGSRLEQERSTLESMRSDLERQKIQAKEAVLADRQAADLAEVGMEAAQRAMRRAERSRAEGILDDVEYEKAQDDLAKARLDLNHAKESADLRKESLEFERRNRELQVRRQELVVDEVRRQVDELSVRAPVPGLVSRLEVNDHDAVTEGQPLVGVVDLSAFEVEILVPESYADELGVGMPAVVTCDGQDEPASIRSISPEVEGSQVRAIVRFDGKPPEGLRQSQRVTTRLVLETKENVLKVPRGPFLDASGGRQAYKVEGSTAELVPVKVGATSVSEAEIVSGLEEGDVIIISDTARFEGARRIFLRR